MLLAPACASMDMFANYNKRGDAFAEAVRELAAETPDPAAVAAGEPRRRGPSDAWHGRGHGGGTASAMPASGRAVRREARGAPRPSRTAAAARASGPSAGPPAPAAAAPATAPYGRLHAARVRTAWDRPLTAYYLILGGSLLITVLGLVMVYSASQIKALQLVAARARTSSASSSSPPLIGAVLLLVASRMPVKLHRALAYPLLAGRRLPDGAWCRCPG